MFCLQNNRQNILIGRRATGLVKFCAIDYQFDILWLKMSLAAGRRVNLRLNIPPEASNSFRNKEHNSDQRKPARIMTARERRVSLFTRILEPSLTEPFYFLYFTAKDGAITHGEHVDEFKRFLLHVNKMKPLPKFIAFCGGLMNIQLDESRRITEEKFLEKALDCLDSQVKVLYVASSCDFRVRLDMEAIEDYRSSFGDDWYEFWVCGVAFLVVNTAYFRKDLDIRLEPIREEQIDWIESELLQQQIFQAKRTIIFQDCAPCGEKVSEKENEQDDGDRLLRRYEVGGVTHLLCRGNYEEKEVELGKQGIKILPNEVNEKDRWFVRLVKVNSDDIFHKSYAPNNLPEHIYL